MRTPEDRGGAKDRADVRKMALFGIVSAFFADTPGLWMMAIKV